MLGFTIGLRALSAAQQAMDVIGQNVSNASTPGYSRRLTELVTTDPLRSGRFQLGTGVQVGDIRRVADNLLEARLRLQHTTLGQLDASGSLLGAIEGAFQEPSDSGLAAGLDDLFNSFSQLTSSPTDVSARDGLVQSATTLAAGFRQVAAQVAAVGDDARRSISAAVDSVNGLASQLAELNGKILQAGASGATPSDLLDARNQLLLQLSELADTQTIDRHDGTVDVLVDGRLLVSHDRADRLESVFSADGATTVRLAGTHEAVDPRGGQLRGFLDLARNVVPARLASLDRIARELMQQINELHATGVSSQGPYTSLVAAVAVDARNGGASAAGRPLAALDLPFAITNGQLSINVVDQATGAVQRTVIDVDPARMSLQSLTARIDAVAHVSASLDSAGRLRIASDAGYGFDFSPRLDPNPDDAGAFGSGTATISTGEGPFALNVNDTLTVSVDGGAAQTITFAASDFADITHATAAEVATAVNARLTGLHAVASDGRLVLQSNTAGAAGSLQVVASSNANLVSAGSVDVGSDRSVNVTFSGSAAAGSGGRYTVVAKGDGTVGVTAGLAVEVRDASGKSLGTFDVGSGYTPGDAIEILPGVKMTLAAGDLEQSHGDAFGFALVDDPDSAHVLGALQIGAFFTGTGAADIDVAAGVAADPRTIAGSRSGEAGDGSNFLALSGLKDLGLAGLSGRTYSQGYGDLVATVGQDVAANATAGVAQTQLLTTLENQRESVSGVNQDEEMLHLVEYQHLYQAAGKYLQTINETQQSLLDMLP
jgi:flagellar hook-associated protein 1 FlgK